MNHRLPTSSTQISLAGHLLVATSKCQDDFFGGSVCLIVHHGSEQSIGLVLNRAIDFDLGVLWEDLEEGETPPRSKPIRFAGPVSGPILALHDQEQLAEVSAADGVYIAARLDRLQELVTHKGGEVRIMVGQAVWKPGQLEAELVQGLWLPVPATPEIVFAPEDDMWRRGMREVGNRYV
jgi:putative transcriptional regulator